MLAVKNKTSLDNRKLICRDEQIKNNLRRFANYEEIIFDDRIKLIGRKIKMIQVIDTDDDRIRYKLVMGKYKEFLEERYDNVSFDENYFDTLFKEECLDNKKNGKLPMFFVYAGEKLIGLAGCRKNFLIKKNNNSINLQEISVRCVLSENNSGLGAIAFFMIYLYCLSKDIAVFTKSFPHVRDFMFHCCEICQHKYLCSVDVYEKYRQSVMKMDIFVDNQHSDIIEQSDFISCFGKKL